MKFLTYLKKKFFTKKKEKDSSPISIIRLATLKDIPFLLHIENSSNQEDLWNYQDFVAVIQEIKCRTLVYQYDGYILGYITIEKKKDFIIVLSLVVHKLVRRNKVGTLLLDNIKFYLKDKWQKEAIILKVRESNIDAQLFLRSQKFICTELEDEGFVDPPENAMIFQWIREHANVNG